MSVAFKRPVEKRIESDAYGSELPCSDCGQKLDCYCPEWAEYCYRHREQRVDPVLLDIRGLVGHWQTTKLPREGTYHSAAEQLNEVLQQHE